MRNHLFVANVYATVLVARAKHAVIETAQAANENKLQLGTATVAGLVIATTARARGFQAGYEFATAE